MYANLLLDGEKARQALLGEIEALKVKVEHERQPNIAFESRNDELQNEVDTCGAQLGRAPSC